MVCLVPVTIAVWFDVCCYLWLSEWMYSISGACTKIEAGS